MCICMNDTQHVDSFDEARLQVVVPASSVLVESAMGETPWAAKTGHHTDVGLFLTRAQIAAALPNDDGSLTTGPFNVHRLGATGSGKSTRLAEILEGLVEPDTQIRVILSTQHRAEILCGMPQGTSERPS